RARTGTVCGPIEERPAQAAVAFLAIEPPRERPAPLGVRIARRAPREEMAHAALGREPEPQAGRAHAVFPLGLLVFEEEALVERADARDDVAPRRQDGAGEMPRVAAALPERQGAKGESGE